MNDLFRRQWERIAARGVSEAWAELEAAYSQPHRHYHNLHHIARVLHWFRQPGEPVPHDAEAEVAIWFHDVIYEPGATDNEEASALLADRLLAAGGALSQARARICQMVRATSHRELPSDLTAGRVADADLAVLAADAAEFAEYERGIRAEYAHLSDATFGPGRRRVLSALLARAHLYATPWFRARLEAPARANLRRSLSLLR